MPSSSILIINSFLHDKNKQGLHTILNSIIKEYTYKFGTAADIPNYDIIYSPSQVINASLYPHKKFIFGPHFSVFPNHQQLHALQAHKYNNSIYIQPSEWAAQSWKNMGAEQFIPIKCFAFPVDTNKFAPSQSLQHRPKDGVLIYYKHRSPSEFKQLVEFLAQQNITNYRIFSYSQRYSENEYLSYLQQCQYGIVLDAHESQGFAIEEALSCNVPLLVWNAQTMNQELNSQYQPIPCTSIPYWDSRCGEYFHHLPELPAAFQKFQAKIAAGQYKPREYILDNLTTEKCAERFIELIQ